MLYWGLRQTSDRNAAPKNDGNLGYTDTLTDTCFAYNINSNWDVVECNWKQNLTEEPLE